MAQYLSGLKNNLNMVKTESVIVKDKVRAGIPTVLLIVGIHPFEPLLAFFREKCLSLPAERSYAQSVGKLIEWLSVRSAEFHAAENRRLLFTAFSHDLRFGSFQDGNDVHGLNWGSISNANLKRLIGCLLEFSDWLIERYGTTMINPIHNQASYTDQLIFWRKWNKQKAGSLLAHTKSHHRATVEAQVGRRHSSPRNRNSLAQETKAFPAEHIDALLWKGFINPGQGSDPRPWIKYNLRDILITLLCLYGGCRESEPLHLWVDDVYIDPNDPESALVLIHEPHEGLVEYTDPLTRTRKKTTRADFLQIFCGGRKSLTLETGRRHAGWKGCLLTHRERKAFQIIWIDKNAGRLFLTLWRLYLQYTRPVIQQMPWAFLTKEAQPLGVIGFSDSFSAAVRRIGLTPAKWAGTTTHALRHRYGQWLNELGLGDKEGQVAMHHINAKSQEVYRQMGIAKIAEAFDQKQITALPEFLSGGGL